MNNKIGAREMRPRTRTSSEMISCEFTKARDSPRALRRPVASVRRRTVLPYTLTVNCGPVLRDEFSADFDGIRGGIAQRCVDGDDDAT